MTAAVEAGTTTAPPQRAASDDPADVRAAAPRPGRTWGVAYRIAGAAFVALLATVGVTNLGFHVVMSRLLGPAGYGELVSLLAFVAILAVPAMAAQTLVTARVARRLATGEPQSAGAMVRRAVAVGAAMSLVLLAAAPALRDYLSLRSSAPILFCALGCVPMTVSVVMWGLLCGQRRFATAGRIALGVAVLRIGFGVLLVSRGYGVAGAAAASAASDCVGALLFVGTGAHRRDPRAHGRPPRPDRLGTVTAVVALAGLWLLVVLDGALARHLFTPVVAGHYQAASAAGRAVTFAAQAVCLVAMPLFAEVDQRRAAAALRVTLGATAAIGGLACAGFWLFGERFAALVFGAGYELPAALLALVAAAATVLALLWVQVLYQLVRGGPAVAVWCGVAVVAVAAAAGPALVRGPYHLAAVMALAGLAGLAATSIAARVRRARPPSPVVKPPTLAPRPAEAVDLTVVVPYFNPGRALRANVLDLVSALRASGVSFEVIAVADGCTDGSAATIADLDPTAVRRLSLRRNAGKGAALRLGLAESRGHYVGFIDADGDLDPRIWQSFLSLMRLYEPDAVIGAKRHPLSEVHEGAVLRRRLFSAGYRGLVRVLFPTLRVCETQVGVKVFRRDLLVDVLPRTVELGFVFDLELLAAAQRLGYRRILPAPVRLQRNGSSTIRLRTVWQMLVATLALAWRVWAVGTYDHPPEREERRERSRASEYPDDRIPVPLARLGLGVGVGVGGVW